MLQLLYKRSSSSRVFEGAMIVAFHDHVSELLDLVGSTIEGSNLVPLPVIYTSHFAF